MDNAVALVCAMALCLAACADQEDGKQTAACDAQAPYAWLDAAHGSSVEDVTRGYGQLTLQRETATFGKGSFNALSSSYHTLLAPSVQALAGLPAWEDPSTPQQLHQAITAALERGVDPQDTTPALELWQQVQKNVLRFVALQVVANARRGSRADVDAAWALFGHGDGVALTGLSAEMHEYDTLLGVQQEPAAVEGLLVLRCAVVHEDATAAQDAASRVEDAVRVGVAYATARYFQRLASGTADRVQLVEGATWFGVVEPWMHHHGHATQAQQIRAWLDPLLPGGGRAMDLPDTAGAAAALNTMRTVFGLNI
jgi:hypothetical protein